MRKLVLFLSALGVPLLIGMVWWKAQAQRQPGSNNRNPNEPHDSSSDQGGEIMRQTPASSSSDCTAPGTSVSWRHAINSDFNPDVNTSRRGPFRFPTVIHQVSRSLAQWPHSKSPTQNSKRLRQPATPPSRGTTCICTASLRRYCINGWLRRRCGTLAV
jgi:hypothetical protein